MASTKSDLDRQTGPTNEALRFEAPLSAERSTQIPREKRLEWTKELARSFWGDLAGTEFLESIAFSKFTSSYLVDIVEPYLRMSDMIFDFGGGDNLYLVRELLRRGYQVSCYEPYSGVEERNFDLRTLPNYRGAVSELPANAYDCVFLSEVIEHLDDAELESVLKTIVSSLKQGGLLVVTTPDNENLFTASRYCPVCKHLFHPWGHVRSFTAETLEKTCNRFGLECEALHTVDFSEWRPVVEQLKENARAMAGAADRLNNVVTKTGDKLELEQVNELKAIAMELVERAGPIAIEDPRRLRIGAGGTLVALCRKKP